MQMRKKGLALLLALLMVFSLLPVSALAADGCLTAAEVSEDKTTLSTKQGAQLKVQLADYFTDSESHSLTYTLSGEHGTQTKIAQNEDGSWYLSFAEPKMGDYALTITATCSGGKTASVKLTITVKEGEKGDPRQYGYNETKASSVKVYVSISSDGVPLVGYDGTILSHLEVNVPYFDLANQSLTDFYRYHTDNGQGEYVDNEVVERPTALHLYLYMIGVYYLGYKPEQIMSGEVQINGHEGRAANVYNMDENVAYADNMRALNITGSATSLYMQQFWGHDENLMYYRNHVYPLMSPGWGSTCDYILLSDGDTIDVALFTDWSFWNNGGAFTAFDKDDYAVAPGETLTFNAVKYDTKSVADGGTEEFDPITGLDVKVYNSKWQEVGEAVASDDDGSKFTYTFDEPGTYYLLGRDTKSGKDARLAPASAKVVVEEAFDPDKYYADYDFSAITLDADGTQYLYNITPGTIEVSDNDVNNHPGAKKTYTVTVPEGAEYVYVTYPANFEQRVREYVMFIDADGNTYQTHDGFDAYPKLELTGDYDAGEAVTVKIPVSKLMESGRYIALEGTDYDYFNCFKFVAGENTKPGETETVPVTGIKLDKTELTLEPGGTATLTAAIEPANATDDVITWSSSNMNVATVYKGKVTAGTINGKTTITAASRDGGFTATCEVTVQDPNTPVLAEDGYYEISTAAQLKSFATMVNNGEHALNARLMNDIRVVSSSAIPWKPIGYDYAYSSKNPYYSGTFDGQGHTISGLYIQPGTTSKDTVNDRAYHYQGLFGICKSATIKNLTVASSTVHALTTGMGAIAGKAEGNTTIENCHSSANFVRDDKVLWDYTYGFGGIVGIATDNTVIRSCSNSGEIKGLGGATGGIVGEASYTVTVENCSNSGHVYSRGIVSKYAGTGGIVGHADSGSRTNLTINNCYNTGKVEYYYRAQAFAQGIGGILGQPDSSANITITNCYNLGDVVCDETTAKVCTPHSIIGGYKQWSSESSITTSFANNYYSSDFNLTSGISYGAVAFNAVGGLTAKELNGSGESVWKDSCPAPVLSGQKVVAHNFGDDDELPDCSKCGLLAQGCENHGDNTETVFRPHAPKDGKFDELTVCNDCLKTIGEAKVYIYGDVNGDGVVDKNDVAIVSDVRNGTATLESGRQTAAADVNVDGTVDLTDYALLTYVCGESPKFTQAAFPVTAKATIEQIMTLEKEHKINVVTISNFYFREACVDVDDDNLCDICKHCQHNSTTTTLARTTTANGYFNQIIKCTNTDCNASSTTDLYYGDMNGDNKVDETDVQFLKDNMEKLDGLTEVQRFAADVDGSGKIDELDLFLLERVLDGSLEQKAFPVTATLSYDTGDAENHYQVVTVNGTTFETPYATGKHTFEDNKCTVCGACSHPESTTVYGVHIPKDGKFDENLKCTVCNKTYSTVAEHYYGDVNGDGKFVAGEFQALIPIVHQGQPYRYEWQKYACDVNFDGKVDDDDIALMSACGRNDIVLPIKTARSYAYAKNDNGTEKHYATITIPEKPYADLSAIYKVAVACTDANDDGRCDLCRHCTHRTTELQNAKDVTCGADGYTGDTVCTVCSETIETGETIPATGKHVDENSDYECDVCGKDLRVQLLGIKLSETSVVLASGDTKTLTVTFDPADATNKTITWTSSNADIAAVDENGVVTAGKLAATTVEPGADTATITATSDDGSFTAECAVKIYDPDTPTLMNDAPGKYVYELWTAQHLKYFANEVNNNNSGYLRNARMMQDIDLSEICSAENPWTPISKNPKYSNQLYGGTFDGQGYAIRGLYLKSDDAKWNDQANQYTALFGRCSGATIKNLSVYGTAEANGLYMAGIVGYAAGNTKIENCHNYVNFTNLTTAHSVHAAGILAYAYRSNSTTSSNYAWTHTVTISNCSNHGTILSNNGHAGGIVGVASGIMDISRCVNYGTISTVNSGTRNIGAGGLVGMAYKSLPSAFQAQTTVTLKIMYSYNRGDVNYSITNAASDCGAGGLVGVLGSMNASQANDQMTLMNCYNTGKITSSDASSATPAGILGKVYSEANKKMTVINVWYLDGSAPGSGIVKGTSAFTYAGGITPADLGDTATSSNWTDSCPAPVLKRETAKEHSFDESGTCTVCGKRTNCEHEKNRIEYHYHTPSDGKFDIVTLCDICLKPTADTTTGLYGDVNGDGVIGATDVSLVTKAVNGEIELDARQFYAADVSGDGKITYGDQIVITRIAEGATFVAQTQLPTPITVTGPTPAAKTDTAHRGMHYICVSGAYRNDYQYSVCTDEDNDKICDVCKGAMPCKHLETASDYVDSTRSDGKFEEQIICMNVDCMEVVETIEHLYGDMNKDGLVNSTDVKLLEANIGDLTEYQREAADLDGSKAVDALDLFLLRQVAANAVDQTTLPVSVTLTYIKADDDAHNVYVTVGDTMIETPYIAAEAHTYSEGETTCNKCSVRGDVNGDTKVNSVDARLVQNYSLGTGTLTEVQIKIADVDGDGRVTVKDAAMIFAISKGTLQ